MTTRSRDTLKKHFADGQRPSARAFAELIESMVNIADDGFNKTAKEGMLIARLDDRSRLIGFCDKSTETAPLWSIGFSNTDPGGGNLQVYPNDIDGPSLTLTCVGPQAALENHDSEAPPTEDETVEVQAPRIRVGINNDRPQHELHVEGVIAADGRTGREGQALADGAWKTILTDLKGCHAYEIMAGVGGGRHSGKYALMHAFAVCAFDPAKGSVTYHHAHFGSRCHRIELRWVGEQDHYSLEMRTGCSYMDKSAHKNRDDEVAIYIRYAITNLWFDPLMTDSVQRADNGNTAQA